MPGDKEKFEYPSTGATPTRTWTPSRNPIYPDAAETKDLGIVRDISAGNKAYMYASALWTYFHRRLYKGLSAADKGGLENFVDLTGGDEFRMLNHWGVPYKVKCHHGDFEFRPARGDRWDLSYTLREERPPYVVAITKAAKFLDQLLFYAPLKADLECFNRWNVTKTYVNTNPYTLRVYPPLTEATPAGPQVNATDGLIKARGESISYASGYPITVAPVKGSVFFIQKGDDAVARSYCLTYDTSVPTCTQYENGVADSTRISSILTDNFENGKLFESDDSLVNNRIRDVMTFGRVLTAAEVLDVHNTMI